MRRVLPIALPLLLVGCQSAGGAAATSPDSAKVPETMVGAPRTTKATDIAILSGTGAVTVGMQPDEAFRAFPRVAGYEFEQNPPGFGDNYRSRHWEDGRRHGFGVILYQSRVVGAMYQEDNATQERVNEFLKLHETRIGAPTATVAGKHLNYWFWEKDGQRLMISAYAPDGSGIQLTAAMGDSVVMDGIGATLTNAQRGKSLTDVGSPPPPSPSIRKG
jgi:hypothetical protein